jgi:hypothetical protein
MNNWKKVLTLLILPAPVSAIIILYISTRPQRIKKKVLKKWNSGKCDQPLACDICKLQNICREIKK